MHANVCLCSGSTCWCVAAHVCMAASARLWILLKHDTIIPAVITIDLAADGDASSVGPRQDTFRWAGEAVEAIQPQVYGGVSSFTSTGAPAGLMLN